MIDKINLHAKIVELIGRDAEERKNAIPMDALNWQERRSEIKRETRELLIALHTYLFGKRNRCIGCPYYEVFAAWLYDTEEERLPIFQQYIADRKRKESEKKRK